MDCFKLHRCALTHDDIIIGIHLSFERGKLRYAYMFRILVNFGLWCCPDAHNVMHMYAHSCNGYALQYKISISKVR